MSQDENINQRDFQRDFDILNNINEDDLLQTIPVMSSSDNYWFIRTNSGQLYTDFKINQYVGISWNEISVKQIQESKNIDDIKKLLKDSETINLEDTDDLSTNIEEIVIDEIDSKTQLSSEQHYSIVANQLNTFVNKISKNDFVLIPNKGSRRFSLGQVLVEEPSDNDVVKNMESKYIQSDFKKRYKVKWLGEFNREDADSSFYKLIYSQRTLTNIDNYRSVINRAIFDMYILDDEIHTTFTVTEPENVDMASFGQFIYTLASMATTINDDEQPIIKTNVQSKGPIEVILKHRKTVSTILTLLVLAGGTEIFTYGGDIKISDKTEFKVSGALTQQAENNKVNAETDAVKSQTEINEKEKNLKLIEKAKALHIPIDDLGINLPSDQLRSIQKSIDEENKKTPSASSSDSE